MSTTIVVYHLKKKDLSKAKKKFKGIFSIKKFLKKIKPNSTFYHVRAGSLGPGKVEVINFIDFKGRWKKKYTYSEDGNFREGFVEDLLHHQKGNFLKKENAEKYIKLLTKRQSISASCA